jgi:small subunit ribosomal protein S17e
MGRVRTMLIKKIAMKTFEQNREKFSDKFEQNKRILKEVLPIKSKKIINKVAGYITKITNMLKSS